MNDISRLNIVYSYKVVKEVLAGDFAETFELLQDQMNSYFVCKSRIQHDFPRLCRENLFYLKNELGKTPILIMHLQTTENRIITNKKPQPPPSSDD